MCGNETSCVVALSSMRWVGASDWGGHAPDQTPFPREGGLQCCSEQRESEGDRPLQGRCMARARHGNGRTVPNGTQPTEIFEVCFTNS